MTLSCAICLDALATPVSLPCGHIFCEECMKLHISHNMTASTGRVTCPTCRKPFNVTLDEFNQKMATAFPYPTMRKLYLPSSTSPAVSRVGSRSNSSQKPQHSTSSNKAESHESEGYLILLSKVSRLETKINEMKRENEKLARESEQRMGVLQAVLADRQHLKLDNERIRKDAWAWRNKYEMLSTRVREGIIWAKEAEGRVGDVRRKRTISQATRPNAFRPQQTGTGKVRIGLFAWWGVSGSR